MEITMGIYNMTSFFNVKKFVMLKTCPLVGWFGIDLETQNWCNVINNIQHTQHCVHVCVLMFSTGMWARLEKRPVAGCGSVRVWLMRCSMSSRQPWAPVRSTARFDLSLLCLSTKVRAFIGNSSRFRCAVFVPRPFQYSSRALRHC